MTKESIINSFDPSQPGLADATIFGLPFSAAQSEVIIIPVPWEVTVSYGSGASKGPEAILNASYQVDLLHQDFPDLWKQGIFFDNDKNTWKKDSKKYKKLAQPIISFLEEGGKIEANEILNNNLKKINKACRKLHDEVRERVLFWLKQGKKVALVGGDHSTPLGFYEAMAICHDSFGILHLDAHMDLRIAYEGFTYSHASIMYNTLQIPQVSKIVQVGIRDFCEEEVQVAKKEGSRVCVFTDRDLKKSIFEGKNWQQVCDAIIAQLPNKIVISFDIDGLYPWYCPNTGTPVPGGFSFEEATYLFNQLNALGKEIIGFDLVEVAPGNDNDWDGNVGARMLFHLCGVLAKSQGLSTGNPILF